MHVEMPSKAPGLPDFHPDPAKDARIFGLLAAVLATLPARQGFSWKSFQRRDVARVESANQGQRP
jgi:hypothetical protein